MSGNINREADHLANLVTEGQRKITNEGVKNTEGWNSVRGCSNGSKKEDGRSGSGVVIKAVDRKLDHNSKIEGMHGHGSGDRRSHHVNESSRLVIG